MLSKATPRTKKAPRRLSRPSTRSRPLYNRFRVYDPSTGRYISADPIGQYAGVNLFAYAESNPINVFDPHGLQFDTLTAGCARGSPSACAALGLPPAAAVATAVANSANQSSAGSSCPPSSTGKGEESEDKPPGPPPLPPRVDPKDLVETVEVPSTPPGAPDPNDPRPNTTFEKAVLIASGIARVLANFFK